MGSGPPGRNRRFGGVPEKVHTGEMPRQAIPVQSDLGRKKFVSGLALGRGVEKSVTPSGYPTNQNYCRPVKTGTKTASIGGRYACRPALKDKKVPAWISECRNNGGETREPRSGTRPRDE